MITGSRSNSPALIRRSTARLVSAGKARPSMVTGASPGGPGGGAGCRWMAAPRAAMCSSTGSTPGSSSGRSPRLDQTWKPARPSSSRQRSASAMVREGSPRRTALTLGIVALFAAGLVIRGMTTAA